MENNRFIKTDYFFEIWYGGNIIYKEEYFESEKEARDEAERYVEDLIFDPYGKYSDTDTNNFTVVIDYIYSPVIEEADSL